MTIPYFIFVYGTLKKGQPNPFSKRLEEEGDYVGEAKIEGSIYNLGTYPGYKIGSGSYVFGQVYKVSAETLFWLDEYECVPELFSRIGIQLYQDEKFIEAQIYVYNGEVQEFMKIESGEYV